MKIHISIDPKGNVTIEGKDTVGPGCTKIQELLAGVVGTQQKQTLKSEYYELPLPDYAKVNE